MSDTNINTHTAQTKTTGVVPMNLSGTDIWFDGLWRQNPGLVQLLGLCPLLAVSNTVINSLGLGLATLLTLVISNTLVSMLRNRLIRAIRIPLYVLVIATTVTIVELGMQAWLPSLFSSLGIFLPLIVTNCMIMGRAEAFAARQPVKLALLDAIAMGTGFLVVLVLVGAIRELLGQGSLFSGSTALFGQAAQSWHWQLFDSQHGFLLAVLPPGAFLALGLLVVIRNCLNIHFEKRQTTKSGAAANGVDANQMITIDSTSKQD